MATASVAVRRAAAAEERAAVAEDALGFGETWKQVKAIPWLKDYFALNLVAYQQIGNVKIPFSDQAVLRELLTCA